MLVVSLEMRYTLVDEQMKEVSSSSYFIFYFRYPYLYQEEEYPYVTLLNRRISRQCPA